MRSDGGLTATRVRLTRPHDGNTHGLESPCYSTR